MNWQTTYPTLETVMAASLETINTWREQLPEPVTDVQRTIQTRLQRRQMEMIRLKLRTKHPDVSEKFENLIAKVHGLGIKIDPRRL